MALRNFCFDITELDKVSTNALIPRFDLAVDDLPIISPRPEVERSGSFRGVQFWPRWKCPCRKVDQGNNGSRSCAMRYVNRDIFWLFWSRAARKSPWIDWEWRTALATKSIAGIQPHPWNHPKDLSELQFGSCMSGPLCTCANPGLEMSGGAPALWFTKTGR
jgi:hypothetical protein